jgi:hypothetical protein
MVDETYTPQCKLCGDTFELGRFQLGFAVCLSCGDEIAHRKVRCIVPPHKQGYMFFTDESAKDMVKGINNKGGLIK